MFSCITQLMFFSRTSFSRVIKLNSKCEGQSNTSPPPPPPTRALPDFVFLIILYVTNPLHWYLSRVPTVLEFWVFLEKSLKMNLSLKADFKSNANVCYKNLSSHSAVTDIDTGTDIGTSKAPRSSTLVGSDFYSGLN